MMSPGGELTYNVVHGIYYDNKEDCDDHLELHEDELARIGMLEEVKQQWTLTTQLTMSPRGGGWISQ